jgi:methionyl-tRNA formyltransferase
MPGPRIVWVGFHSEGVPALRALIDSGANIVGLITLNEKGLAKRSSSVDFKSLLGESDVPVYEVSNINNELSVATLRELQPDLLVVFGWSQILSDEVLQIPEIGTVGAHASLLPHNRGSAPVNWAIIRGETEGGNTLMWLDSGVDTGRIIDQIGFPIEDGDTCATVYEKVADTNKTMLQALLEKLEAGEDVPGRIQTHVGEPLPRRRPEDGLVDWNQPAKRVYDFVRALTEPYPGAFSFVDDEMWTIWRARLGPPDASGGYLPGTVLCSTEAGQLVACGEGTLVVLEAQNQAGDRFTGDSLTRLDWKGKQFQTRIEVPT